MARHTISSGRRGSAPVACAAVDLGATSGRVILGLWAGEAGGRLRLTEAHRFPNAYRELGPHAYWDIGQLWHEVRSGLVKAAALVPHGGRLASVGVDSWGCDHVLLDDSGRIVFPLHAYRDNRVQPALKALNKDRASSARLYAATGIPNLFYNTSLHLAETLDRYPAIRGLATRCLFLPDYFNFLLSGRLENELTISSTSQLLGVQPQAEWAPDALAHFGIPPEWFRTPILPGTPLGPARSIPELRGAQVIAVPGHDTACAYDAMPASEDGGDLYLSSGTWSLIGFENPTPLLGPAAQKARIANERAGGGHFRPLTNIDGLFLLEQLMVEYPEQRPKNAKDWAALVSAAEALRPASKRNTRAAAGGPALLKLNDGSFANPASMRAAIDSQLRKRKLPLPADLAGYARLIYDSIAHSHAEAMHLFERLTNKQFKRILMVGGGSKNRLLCQATADAAGIPVHSFSLEGTAVGNIARQLIALGAVKDLRSFRHHLSAQLTGSARYHPRSRDS
ncbi:rhamnulokinase [Cephaloticoccus primus]|uniref:rhamnulokinase n=1 Tax=Cephaloticoccus primus TaxID=1548207 RepID=UPI001E627488|nr:FGGY-family carbohydrate kinase [Cephaloticoccus primus]